MTHAKTRIVAVETFDVRFPTSDTGFGSDAMNPDPDYSAAYVVLRTDGDHEGHGFAFTIGRGNEVQLAAIDALAPMLVDRTVAELGDELGSLAVELTSDPPLRWLGPEKGVVHMAAAALLNAAWDLHAKHEGKPLWKVLVDMTPEQLVAAADLRYLADALHPDEAVELLRAQRPFVAEREAALLRDGLPAYTTSAGWIGYDDDRLRAACRDAVAAGWTAIKVKVGGDPDDDVRRLEIVRAEIGDATRLLLDANQRWDVPTAIERMRVLARFDPWWIEEPTSPDDVLGLAAIARAVAPVTVASGEHAHNRIMFKQLMQAGAIAVCQLDACRLAGVNEVVAVLLLAAKFGVPVCPHAGGVGLCELVQHIAAFDLIAVSGPVEGRMVEYVEHLHEHFVDPVVLRGDRYLVPTAPGYSSQLLPDSLADHQYPEGPVWRTRR